MHSRNITRCVTTAALLALAAVSLSALSGCKSGNTNTVGKEIIVGEYGALTGPQASFGKSTNEGIQLATEQANAAGGIDGKTIKVVVEDDMSDAAKAEIAVKRLIDEEHVIAVLGEVASGSSLAGGQVCQQAHIPMVSPSSTNPSVTQIGNDIFRVCFIDPFQAAVVARFVHDYLHVTRVATFTNKSAPYSTGFTQNFITAFTGMGGQVIAQQSYGQQDTDYRGALSTIKATNPQAILVPGYYTDAGAVCKQARDLGIKVPIVGGDGWDSQLLFNIGGSAVNGCYFSDHVSMDNPSPVVQKFVQDYKARFGHTPDALAALAYDAANLTYAAMKRAKALTPDDIRAAIATTTDFPGVTGKITIDANRNASKPAVIIGVQNGQFKYVTTITDPSKPLSQQPAAPSGGQ
ncbi:MAG: ABC transporter substrate-binding protein [Armatimonadetes bacterium]|nr:ABC transporter substrate-binding protein [Armatimonadota bacterium]MDE2205434.1 ABC transporter substrate-binding protein [Armatimonadota bacterium]